MFDVVSAELLRSAPSVPGLNPNSIPALLTAHYANLVSARLRGASKQVAEGAGEEWPLERIADTYELITSLHTNKEHRRASAFVAATAQQILARRQAEFESEGDLPWNIDRDRVDPTIAAALLFLSAEQYADANEAASAIKSAPEGQMYEVTILAKSIVDLARGQLNRIIARAARWRKQERRLDLEERAFAALLETLIAGIEILAAQFLGRPIPVSGANRFDSPRQAFMQVLELSSSVDDENAVDLGGTMLNAYAGPYHLASLLLATDSGISEAGLISVPPPDGADPEFWRKWLGYRANKFPFVWKNHREAIAKDFYQTTISAVMILPTGAGKTTVSSLKIAGALARGKKVIFLAPTHALVEQLTEDLQEMFPKNILGSVVSSDFDLLFQTEAQLREIEVMTPERCLAMLSFAPEAFSDVGLLVFDECHLLSPQSGKIRRALDGMLCLLGFHHVVPDADTLFLSAMLKDSEEFALWIGQLTGRPSVCVDLLWKPSRQARGVVIYKDEELNHAIEEAASIQRQENKTKGKVAKSLRAVAKRQLVASPWAIWGLQHNWLGEKQAQCILSGILDETVTLAGSLNHGSIRLTPNANQVAVRLAVAGAINGLKSIVFVNTKLNAISVAKGISETLGEDIDPSDDEKVRWDALQAELGNLKHAVLSGPTIAVPHNSSMLRLERDLAERMFRRQNGAKVIVATPTLAQGLNLPAHLAILAGDKRADANRGGREDLEAHEILNAAARAGRAGHLANGVVLLIPEPVISFSDGQPLDRSVVDKLKSVLPEDDRCVVISDPLEIVLDRLMQGDSLNTDVRYMINRMAVLREVEGVEEPTLLFDLSKSLGAYAASRRSAEHEFNEKINCLKKAIADEASEGIDGTIALLASQSGLSTDLLVRLKSRIADGAGSLPLTVGDWLMWTLQWLGEDEGAKISLLGDVKAAVLGACGMKKDGELTQDVLSHLTPGLLAWIQGQPLCTIEEVLGGDPNSTSSQVKQRCPRARELVGSVVPRGISFIMGLVSHVVKEVNPFDEQEELSQELVECLSTAVRKGYDLREKLFFATDNPNVLSRVQVHRKWAEQHQLS